MAGRVETIGLSGLTADVDGNNQLRTAPGSVAVATSLAAVAANGNGAAIDFGCARQNISVVVVTTGTPTGGTVTLHVSHDGTNWFATTTTVTVSGTLAASVLTGGAWRYARAVLAGLTGGVAPTVTVTLAAQ